MAPPSIGPSTLATMKTVDTIAIYFPNFSVGIKVGAMTIIME
jgi:hypothetical protein